ncbi:hypothetical protein B1759_08155 [Rubrivirga sp. SAORIC476]|nr:hypothetical protein B1759_08155 [Rubrivirga sp. SAORIC476]
MKPLIFLQKEDRSRRSIFDQASLPSPGYLFTESSESRGEDLRRHAPWDLHVLTHHSIPLPKLHLDMIEGEIYN